ncbi:uncharacterized protein L969DRAFT_160713 [Mixia osmundae IAM 14324]|uniref:Threonine/serine exporter-like N-terminal domain-containing protein n=1 Tax=Mixia osmundae (strain CBS 9802 / IAM 14324 / JCM 22182 / KY 12970) TaxID=764103 RepID=G7DZC8_MIXOS|nr:uncharacterized protein L969DRAFT_160713 [Mixia osmundae IAM 14324]KEI42597.1 hypothetical protein L969DRAFT_160713 [Mixia osmundae IAM 14324]GAA95938.1 hypothetical protein E5Q_02596 [Mixia osmundae IAM 14324]
MTDRGPPRASPLAGLGESEAADELSGRISPPRQLDGVPSIRVEPTLFREADIALETLNAPQLPALAEADVRLGSGAAFGRSRSIARLDQLAPDHLPAGGSEDPPGDDSPQSVEEESQNPPVRMPTAQDFATRTHRSSSASAMGSASAPAAGQLQLPQPAVVQAKRRVQWVGIMDGLNHDHHERRPNEPSGHHPLSRENSLSSSAGAKSDAPSGSNSVDGGHVALTMPTPSPMGEQPRGDKPGFFDAWADRTHNESSGLRSGQTTPGTPPSGMTTPATSRPGTPDSDIDIIDGERDGLPTNQSQSRQNKMFTRQAAKLVAVHKAKGRFTALAERARANNAGKEHKAKTKEELIQELAPPGPDFGILSNILRRAKSNESEGADASSPSERDSEKTITEPLPAVPRAPAPQPPAQSHEDRRREQREQRQARPGGTGVLSSLLRLYELPASAVSSSATLVADNFAGRRGRDSRRNSDDPAISRTHSESDATRLGAEVGRAFRSVATGTLQGLGKATAGGVSGVEKAANSIGIEGEATRPAAARSGAGVFGALQASAFNLSGVATPTGSSVAPNPNKSGFRISRYHRDQAVESNDSPLAHTPGSTSPVETPSRNQSDSNLAGMHKTQRAFSHASRSASHLSLGNLGEFMDPKKFHNESAVLKHRRTASGTASPAEYVEKERAKHGLPATPGRHKRDKRRQEEIFITMHVAAILQRQDFVLRLARALMMFGGPSHRIESQIQATAKVLDLQCQVIYLLNFMIISFADEDTHTNEIKFIKQNAALDLGKLTEIATLHYEVMHDQIGVEEASAEMSKLMKMKPTYTNWQFVLIGGLCSLFIGIASFDASVVDFLASFILGGLVVAVQCFVATKSDILSNIFEIAMAALCAFIAAALASTKIFCFSAIISSSIVLILPGWLVCNAALELQARSIVCGSVRLVFSVIYALFLGFGIGIGGQFWRLVSGDSVVTGPQTNSCSIAHGLQGDETSVPIWRSHISLWFAFLAVPGYAFCLALRNSARLRSKELPVMVVFASIGWTTNHFASIGFPNRSDISSALGALAVGLLGNVYGKLFQGTAFIVTIVPVLFQLPSGLSNGGLLIFASTTDSTTSFSSGFAVGEQLVQVSIGLTFGLFVALVLVYPFGKRRGGLFTF